MNKSLIANIVIGIVLSAAVLFVGYTVYQDHKQVQQDTAAIAQVVSFINAQIKAAQPATGK